MHQQPAWTVVIVLASLMSGSSAARCAAEEEAAKRQAPPFNAPTALTGLSSRPIGIAFFPDARRLVAAEINAKIKVWELTTGRPTASHDAGTGYFTGMELDPTGTLLAVARKESGSAGQVTVLDASRLTVRYTIATHASGLSFSPDGKTLSIARSGGLYTYDAVTGRKITMTETKLRFDGASSIAFTKNREAIALVLWQVDGAWVALWKPATDDKLRRLTGYMARTYRTAFSPNGEVLVVGAYQKTDQRYSDDGDVALSLFDPVKEKRIAVFQERPLDVTAVAFSNDGRRVASAHKGGVVRLWDAANQRVTAVVKGSKDWQITCVAFSADGRLLAAGTGVEKEYGWEAGGQVLLWRLKSP